MSIRINEYCIACGWCQPLCKNGAIKEGENMQYAIDPSRCTECVGWYDSPECINVCFQLACEPDPAHKESHEQLIAKWKKLHPRKTPVMT